MVQELYCKNVFTSVRPFVEECIQSTCLISGGSPYPRMDGKKMANLLEEGYRMPKPQHVDEKLYEKIVLLLVLFLFLSSYSSNIYKFFLWKLHAKLKIKPVFLSEWAYLGEILEWVSDHEFVSCGH